ncbi:MAG: hypothetical protein EXS05_21275 [Planctomycetaceae bacterium]|nr:hypothetical protein [Planctomycetaceae bacterium]
MRLTASRRALNFDVDGLDPSLADAGPEAQTVFEVVNSRLPKDKRIGSPEKEIRGSPKADPKNFKNWKLSMNVGIGGPERDRVGWHEIAVGSDRRSRISKVRYLDEKEETVLFDGELTDDELESVLNQACSAISSGPPVRRHDHANGRRVRLTLTTSTQRFQIDAYRLSPDLNEAGPEVRELIKIINDHLPCDSKIALPEQSERVP